MRQRWLQPAALGVRRLSVGAACVVVHSREEVRRLEGFVPAHKLAVVPHFVEERAPLITRDGAKRRLDLEGRRVITLLGHMVRRRGHALLLEALPSLPGDVAVCFVGSPIEGREARRDELLDHARDLGAADRVRFTGYVPDNELEVLLAATDVAVCPFRDMSASGALATWISTGRPIVTSDLPALRELDELSPGALRTFSPYEAGALAAVLEATLAHAGPLPDPAVDRLRQRLATPRVLERYLDVYRAATGRAGPTGGRG
jgi:glycosyltransferase involved in cell wall biosynthesis